MVVDIEKRKKYDVATKWIIDASVPAVVVNLVEERDFDKEELLAGEYPEEYFKEAPQEVESHFMARAEEIKKNAEESLKIYKADENYLYIVCNMGALNESEKEKCHIRAAMGYVSGLKEFIEKNDYLSMRRHERAGMYLERFAECRKAMEQILNVGAEDKTLPMGRLSLFDLFE